MSGRSAGHARAAAAAQRWMPCIAALLLAGCAATRQPPIRTVAHVDLPRFMGAWYVIAAIPTFIEKDAYNAVESYRLASDGTIATTYTFRKGGIDGPAKAYHPRGFVLDRTSNARWGMRFVWPIKAQYLIAYLSEDYRETIIARDARDYVWIMARTPSVSVGDYLHMRAVVASLGYDASKLRLVPQRWPAPPRVPGAD